MRKVAFDTNALVSFRIQREPGFTKAKRLFQECLEGQLIIFLTTTVLLEAEWVLRSVYKQDKEKIVEFFEELVFTDNIILKEQKDIELALNLYKNNSKVSFTDCLIIVQVQNFQIDEFLTLDEDLKKAYEGNLG